MISLVYSRSIARLSTSGAIQNIGNDAVQHDQKRTPIAIGIN